ncbi:MAG: RluA family pseudouridine synthase [Alphaproteobacteria bacterium]|nr:RluA family pseudouridine synthase [Alphaproteobacteria bacterium]
MTSVVQRYVKTDEEGIRLDRWFQRHYPQLTHGALEKLLRTGQVRVDGARVKASHRVTKGEVIRVPPLPAASAQRPAEKPQEKVTAKDRAFIRSLVIHRDRDVIVLNKPAGLAVQGGTKTERHVDGLLPGLVEEGGERPRLVHRLDRDTSGVLVIAANARAAAALAQAFRARDTRKTYWALTNGIPIPRAGRIDAALIKRAAEDGRERVRVAFEDEDEDAKSAVTLFQTMEQATTMAWLALMPLTGRTHQLRAHCAAIGTPIVGDAKYGGVPARTHGEVPNRLMLHARALRIRHPDGTWLEVSAPLPPHMQKVWSMFGFDENDRRDPFADATKPPKPREDPKTRRAPKPYDKKFKPRRGGDRAR